MPQIADAKPVNKKASDSAFKIDVDAVNISGGNEYDSYEINLGENGIAFVSGDPYDDGYD